VRDAGVVVDGPRGHKAQLLVKRDRGHLRTQHHDGGVVAPGLRDDGLHDPATDTPTSLCRRDGDTLDLRAVVGQAQARGADDAAIVVDGQDVQTVGVLPVEFERLGDPLLVDEHGAPEREASVEVGGIGDEADVHGRSSHKWPRAGRGPTTLGAHGIAAHAIRVRGNLPMERPRGLASRVVTRVGPLLLGAILFAVDASPARASDEPTLDLDAFVLTVQPERIVLGDTTSAVVRVKASDDDGLPLDDTPTLTSSVGTLSEPRRVAAGEWTATYTPPTSLYPQVALITARTARGPTMAVGLLAVPLWAKAQARATTKPLAQVTVTVADASYGPVASDAKGDVVVPILVPPGTPTALVSSVDVLGNKTEKPLPLGVPGFARLSLVPLDDPVAADDRSVGRVLIGVVDAVGAPLASVELTAATTVGSIGTVRALAPGLALLTWRPGLTTAREAVITVGLAGDPTTTTTTTVRLLLAAPVRAEIVASTTALTADDEPVVSVRVVAFDAASLPVPPSAIAVDVDAGRVARQVIGTGDTLERQLEWVLPRSRERSSARLIVTNPNAGDAVLGEITLALLPGAPAQLRLEVPPAVKGDGVAEVPVVVTVLDAAGNELMPQGVVLEVPDGTLIGGGVDVEARRWRARYRPAPTETATQVTMTARLRGLSASAPLSIAGHRALGWLVGPGLGSWSSVGDVVAIGPELSMLAPLPVLDGRLHAGLTLGVHEGLAVASNATFSSWRSWPLWLEGAWRPWLTPAIGLHIGAQGGLTIIDAAVDAASAATRRIEPGLAVAGVVGLVVPVGPGTVDLGLRLGISPTLAAAPLVQTSPLGAGLFAAYRFDVATGR
jgi:hypothetical protein